MLTLTTTEPRAHCTQNKNPTSRLTSHRLKTLFPDRNPHNENHFRRPTGASPWEPEYRMCRSKKTDFTLTRCFVKATLVPLAQGCWTVPGKTAAEPNLSQAWFVQIKHKPSTCKLIRYLKKKQMIWARTPAMISHFLRDPRSSSWDPRRGGRAAHAINK